VGKSTIAICLAVEGMERGLRVLLVDADPQATSRTWGDAALGGGHPAPTVVAMGATMIHPGQLDALVGGYDLVVIDCPPRHDETQRAALMLADLALLPCGPSSAEAWALASSIELVTVARRVRPELRAAVVITRKKPRTALGKSARDELADGGLPVLATEIGDRIAYQEAIGFGLGATTYAPRDPAATETRALYDEIASMKKEAPRGR
jgi:chromosome partitioning protein